MQEIFDGDPVASLVMGFASSPPSEPHLRVRSTLTLALAMRMVRDTGIRVLAVDYPDRKDFGIVRLSDERMYIRCGQRQLSQNEERHIARYRFALNFVPTGGKILDAACGSGYGSVILSGEAVKVTAVDVARKALDFALRENARENIEYRCQDILELVFEPRSLDAVVSLETLEHLSHESATLYLARAAGWIVPGGVLVASSPMLRYQNGRPYVTNPYHINEMDKLELIGLIREKLAGFTVHLYHQKQTYFLPLQEENSGFCVIVARKYNE